LIWALGGGKGGTGKTLIAASLGILLAREGYDVIVFDGDFGAPNLHTAFGIDRPSKTLLDFILGREKTLRGVVAPTPMMSNLRIVAGAPAPMNAVGGKYAARDDLPDALDDLKCDILIIDTGSGTGARTIELFLKADVGTVVTTPELASIEQTYRYIKAILYHKLKSLDIFSSLSSRRESVLDDVFFNGTTGDMVAVVEKLMERAAKAGPGASAAAVEKVFDVNMKLMVNMAKDRRDQLVGASVCEIVGKFYGVDMDYIGYVPFDERIARSSRRGRPFVMEHPTSEVAACFTLAQKELLRSAPEKPAGSQLSLMRS